MSLLPAKDKAAWRDLILHKSTDWVLFGVEASQPPKAIQFCGPAGIIDWMLHGQVSRLTMESKLAPGSFCYVPSNTVQSKKNFLCYLFQPGKIEAKKVIAELNKLGAKEVSLIATTFPQDFFSKIVEDLRKEGVACRVLELAEE